MEEYVLCADIMTLSRPDLLNASKNGRLVNEEWCLC